MNLGDASKPKAWSKYSQESSAYGKLHKKEEPEKEIKIEKEKTKREKKKEKKEIEKAKIAEALAKVCSYTDHYRACNLRVPKY